MLMTSICALLRHSLEWLSLGLRVRTAAEHLREGFTVNEANKQDPQVPEILPEHL